MFLPKVGFYSLLLTIQLAGILGEVVHWIHIRIARWRRWCDVCILPRSGRWWYAPQKWLMCDACVRDSFITGLPPELLTRLLTTGVLTRLP